MVHHFHRIIIFRKGSINAKAEWFGMDMIRLLLARMKADNNDGVRIYFARGVANDYTKRVAKFVIVRTSQYVKPNTNDTIHKDYFGCNETAQANIPVKHKKPLSELDKLFLREYSNRNKMQFENLVQNLTVFNGSLDNGEVCPNHCQGAILVQ